MKASISTMRRWGISWRRIALCMLGFHTPIAWGLVCGRCGAVLPRDIYRSHTGAADLIPNKITRRGWIGQPRETEGALMRHAVMWEHVNGQTTGKHSEGDES